MSIFSTRCYFQLHLMERKKNSNLMKSFRQLKVFCTSILHRMDSNSPLAPHKTSNSPWFIRQKKKVTPHFSCRKNMEKNLQNGCVFRILQLPTILFSQLTAFCTLGTTKATNSSLGGHGGRIHGAGPQK